MTFHVKEEREDTYNKQKKTLKRFNIHIIIYVEIQLIYLRHGCCYFHFLLRKVNNGTMELIYVNSNQSGYN